ncbi:hypothetical protein PEB0150_011230 [Bartonella apis]|nr:hypothetical protein PEB0150_011230 [Bartonella apis]
MYNLYVIYYNYFLTLFIFLVMFFSTVCGDLMEESFTLDGGVKGKYVATGGETTSVNFIQERLEEVKFDEVIV